MSQGKAGQQETRQDKDKDKDKDKAKDRDKDKNKTRQDKTRQDKTSLFLEDACFLRHAILDSNQHPVESMGAKMLGMRFPSGWKWNFTKAWWRRAAVAKLEKKQSSGGGGTSL